MKTLEEIALQIGKEVFGAVDECLSGQGERDREVTAGEYPIGEGCIDFARRLVAALGAQQEPVAWGIGISGELADVFLNKQYAELECARRDGKYPDPTRKFIPLYAAPEYGK